MQRIVLSLVHLMAVALISTGRVNGQDSGAKGPALAPEVAKLGAAVDRLKAIPGIRATVEWKIWYLTGVLNKSGAAKQGRGTHSVRKSDYRPSASGERVEYSAKTVMIAAGRKYRISQVYDASMPGMAFEAAYDGRQFQFLLRADSELQYSSKERREILDVFLPNVQLSPFEFLGPSDSQRAAGTLMWPDLFNEKRIRERLAKGLIGSTEAPSGKRPFVTFDVSARSEEAPMVYRVFVDGPDGQPSEVDELDRKGSALTVSKFQYAQPVDKVDWWLPVGLETVYYDKDGKAGWSMTAKTTKLDVAPKIPEDPFTIDFVSANTVIDMDKEKTVKDSDLEPGPGAVPPAAGSGSGRRTEARARP